MSETGVYQTKLKNGKPSYRASLTSHGRHISLGSFPSRAKAHRAYLEGRRILSDDPATGDLTIDRLESIASSFVLSYSKIVMLLNLRDNGLYFATPIYIRKRLFHYYLSETERLTFDREDLFYYARHRIMRRGGHLFVADYGSQVTIFGRYGIRPFAVKDRDYRFINGDDTDFRYSNIEIINPYHGVLRQGNIGNYKYKAFLHLRGNHTVGTFDDPETAAIAYNKAVDLAKKNGITKDFPLNYLDSVAPRTYAEIYDSIRISDRLTTYLNSVLTAAYNPQN